MVVDASMIGRAVAVLRAGGIVAVPTETVYGLGADATNDDAVRRVFAVKGRPVDHPLIVHLADVSRIDDWAIDVSDDARRLAATFWPGPLTLLLRRAPSASDVVAGGRSTIAVRVPDHPVTLALLRALGRGLAAPSANRFGRVSPTTAAHVRADLGDEVDLVIDGGPCTVGVESTIVDMTGDQPVVVRAGAITAEQLSAVLGRTVAVATIAAEVGSPEAAAPGTLAAHYAPDARVHLTDAAGVAELLRRLLASVDGRIGLLAPGVVDDIPDGVVELEPAGQATEYATVLYSRLRQADRLGIDHLVCVPPESEGIGVAVIDRLRRAASR